MKKIFYMGIVVVVAGALWLNFQMVPEAIEVKSDAEIRKEIEEIGAKYGLQIEFHTQEVWAEGDYLEFDTVEEFEQFFMIQDRQRIDCDVVFEI